MASTILILLAALCNGLMDTISHHFPISIFSKIKNQKIKQWFKSEWQEAYVNRDVAQGRKKLFWKIPFPTPFLDGWHFFKAGMILFVCLSAFFAVEDVSVVWIVIYILSWYLGFQMGYRGAIKH